MAKHKNQKTTIIFLIVLVTVLSLTIVGILFKDNLTPIYDKIVGNVFTYDGMTFFKEKVGNLTLYSTELAIKQKDDSVRYYVLRLYNDPRTLRPENNITKRVLPIAYISITNNSINCLSQSSSIPDVEISMFINAIGSKASGAFAEYSKALEELNASGNYTEKMILEKVKNCSDSKRASVIIFDAMHDVQRIYNEGNCYIIEAKNCNRLEAAETFILDLIYIMRQAQEPENESQDTSINNDTKKDIDLGDISKQLNISSEDLVVGS